MKTKWVFMSFIGGAMTCSPLGAATNLSSGLYQTQVNPAVDSRTASNMEKALDGIQEIDQIHVDPTNSSVRFHVKENQSVDYARIQSALQVAAPNAQLQSLVWLDGHGGSVGTSGSSGITSVTTTPNVIIPASTNASFTLQQNGVAYICSPQR